MSNCPTHGVPTLWHYRDVPTSEWSDPPKETDVIARPEAMPPCTNECLGVGPWGWGPVD